MSLAFEDLEKIYRSLLQKSPIKDLECITSEREEHGAHKERTNEYIYIYVYIMYSKSCIPKVMHSKSFKAKGHTHDSAYSESLFEGKPFIGLFCKRDL